MPAMLADLVVQLLGERMRVEIAGRTASGEDALEQARAADADLLVVLDDPGSAGCLGAVLAQPRLSILTLSDGGESGEVVRLGREVVALDRCLATAITRPATAGVG
jgi:hypothetical protein